MKTSIHIKPAKYVARAHNLREKELPYVRKDLSANNDFWEAPGFISVANAWQKARVLYRKSVGQKMQAKATPIREGVVVISADTTMDDLKELAARYEQEFGIKALGIYIHRDEGHFRAGNEKDWLPNLHAHVIFRWHDDSGKSIRLNKGQTAAMQTIAAEVLGMERGEASGREHEQAMRYKIRMQAVELSQLQKEVAALAAEKSRLMQLIDYLYNYISLRAIEKWNAWKREKEKIIQCVNFPFPDKLISEKERQHWYDVKGGNPAKIAAVAKKLFTPGDMLRAFEIQKQQQRGRGGR